MKTILKEILPRPLIRLVGRLIAPFEHVREFSIDAWRYLKHSSPRDGVVGPADGVARLEAQITKDYHRVEKGLTLSEPKRPFGIEVHNRLSSLVPQARERVPQASFVRFADDALEALASWNELGTINSLVSPEVSNTAGRLDDATLSTFFSTRRSVRNFDTAKPVDTALLRQATMLALNTPSVCNRQAGRVHYFTDKFDVERILRLQNGNAGFRASVGAVAIVTVDSRLFTGATERNQRWVDGGLFAMTLVWALHGVGLQTCMLNWSATNRRSQLLRAETNVDAHEDIVVLIAIGHAQEGHRVARSERRQLHEVMTLA
ncbi:nitroreductase family protein [Arthrobacter cavernae]|uniref:Nitroreductase n=1 Tax=Arthrobacter cavernae TaxID=2817681 RepID=A0A939KM08_9MICC|nr:nitroreductase family protein [Arthrobacter cavernae]MBO1267721.1 hypothetical protein [Arthrobacter cavernae]